MNITKVSYGRTFPLGNYASERIDVEATVDNVSTFAGETLHRLKEFVEDIHRQNNPHLYQETTEVNIHNFSPGLEVNRIQTPTEEFPKKSPKELIINQINLCSSIEVLKSFELLANNQGGEVKTAYELKYKELSK